MVKWIRMLKKPNGSLGNIAEEKAKYFLQAQGLVFLEANFRSRFGEIDLIFLDKETVVFVEVRARTHKQFGTALESISFSKQQKLLKTALYYQYKRQKPLDMRFDAVAFDAGLENIQWVRHIIEAS